MLHHLCQFYRHKSSHQKPTTTMSYCKIHIRNKKTQVDPFQPFQKSPPSSPFCSSHPKKKKKRSPKWRNNSGHEVRSSSPPKKNGGKCGVLLRFNQVGRLVGWSVQLMVHPVSLGPKKPLVWAPRICRIPRIRNNNPGFILGDPMGIPNHQTPQTNN